MTDFQNLSIEDLQEKKSDLLKRYEEFKSRNITLDMTRGKPCSEQLDLAVDMLDCVRGEDYKSENGTDCRNYGGLDGIPEAKALFAEYMGADADEIIIGASSSLNMMHDTFMRAMVKGITADTAPWMQQPGIKFLCPSPGYDRHFFICDYLGLEMIPVELDDNGPDMDTVEDLVKNDETIKGIWCVPKYSNPTGIVYSDEVVDRLAGMEVKAPDFRIFWDNAYAVHHLSGSPAPLKNILSACKDAGNPDRVLMWGSTSKISFAGSGIAMMAGSKANMDRARSQMSFQTIGPDKLNQLRHVKFFKNMDGILDHMQKHAAILKPKFDAVDELLEKALAVKNIAAWSKPDGGYFVSLDTLEGCAAAVIKMAADAGVKLTPAGSTYPLKKDPLDRNIRLAPSFPPMDDIRQAMELVGICVQLVSIDKILGQ
ncbi:MAG: aminotransferase class I/II-fold pyridoxal phosphate-dependent enzyme [Deltaproteobacteria bacterium]|jgi:DNA-binding transcriptional MocR family regulator|nr:aminotransferase class I/II-fold pyridoxal phosphate-dependent enzyme [Deltaproteobacteria bacterium]